MYKSFVEFSLSKLLQEERFKIHFDGYRRPSVVIWSILYGPLIIAHIKFCLEVK